MSQAGRTRDPREISRSPRLAHKAPVMQAKKGHEHKENQTINNRKKDQKASESHQNFNISDMG